MGVDPEVQARLLELYYGLLSEEESAALRQRIASDPEWSEAWAHIQQIAESLGEASKLRTARVELPRPEEFSEAESPPRVPAPEPARPMLLSESVRPSWGKTGSKSVSRTASPIRTGSWAVGVVYAGTALLLLAALWGAMVHRRHLLALTGQHLRLVVQGPSVLQAGVENHFIVLTSRVDGSPVESQVELALFAPDQKRFFSQKENADAAGQLRVVIPADMALPEEVLLKVVAEAGGKSESTSARLKVAPAQYQTFLALDRFYYRPGERVVFRSLTVNRFHRVAGEELWVEFEVRDAEDHPVPGSYQEGRTHQGVGCGEFRIPSDWPSGVYMVVVRNAQRRFPEVRKPFWVLPGPGEPLEIEMEFRQPHYGPGETVAVDMEFSQPKGVPAAELPVEISAEVLGRTVHQETLQTNRKGRIHTSFRLPDRIPRADAWLVVKAGDAKPPVLRWKPIPLRQPLVDVRFYPEGGVLTAGVENRVYFSVRDAAGRPGELQGVLLDQYDRQVAEVRTTHAGRGVFQFVPAEAQRYRLRIVQPEGIREEPELPPPSADAKVAIKTGLAVVGPGKPVEFHLLSSPSVKTEMPLIVGVSCRGVQVGRQWVVPRVAEGGKPTETPIQIPLPPSVWGLLRLRVYDYSGTPPTLLAERLLFRMPEHRLRVELSPPSRPLCPNESVQVRVSTKDEQAAPVAAVAGLSVVEERLLGSFGGLSSITPFWFLEELWDIPEDLNQVGFFMSEDSQSQAALDLLLGTWEGYAKTDQTEGSSAAAEEQKPGLFQSPETTPGSSPLPEDAPPLVFDNLLRIQAACQEAMEVFQKDRPLTLNAITLLSLFGGAALLLFVTLATLLHVSSGLRIWVSALLGAGLCVGIGLVLVHPGLLRAGSLYAVPFVEYPPSDGSESHWSGSELPNASFPLSPEEGHSLQKKTPSSFSSDSSREKISSEKRPLPHLPTQKSLVPGMGLGLSRNALRRLLWSGSEEAQRLVSGTSAQGSKKTGLSGLPVSHAGKKDLPSEEQVPASQLSDSSASGSSSGKQSPIPEEVGSSQSKIVEAEPRGSAGSASTPGTRFVMREYAYQAARSPTPLDIQTARGCSLLYWHPFLLTGPEGSSECRFDLPELPSTFRIRAETYGAEGRTTFLEPKIPSDSTASASHGKPTEGRIAFAETKIISQPPLQIHLAGPEELSDGDRLLLPLSVQNLTSQTFSGDLFVEPLAGCRLTGEGHRKLSLPPHGEHTFLLPIEGKLLSAKRKDGGRATSHSSSPPSFTTEGVIKVHAISASWRQGVEKHFHIHPTGYATERTWAGWVQKTTPLHLEIPSEALEGTLRIRTYLLPTFLAELELAAQEIHQLPAGCLESLLVGNALAGWAIREIQLLSDCPPGLSRLWRDRLRTGFDRTLQARTPDGGFRALVHLPSPKPMGLLSGSAGEFFAFASQQTLPEHPLLTAWTLVHFDQLARGWPVEAKMRDQAAQWLLSLQEQSGGFSIPAPSAAVYCLPSKEAMDILFTWALAETGQKKLDLHLLHTLRLVEKSKDPVLTALAALGALRSGKPQEAAPLLEQLAQWQNDQGEIAPEQGSNSNAFDSAFFGVSDHVAGTALAALAWMQQPEFLPKAEKAIHWLARQRQADGSFGPPTATLLAFWALAEYRKIHPAALEPGEFRVRLGEKVLTSASVSSETFAPVVLEGGEEFLSPGEHNIHLEWTGSGRLPYLVVVSYHKAFAPEQPSPKELPPKEAPPAGHTTPTAAPSTDNPSPSVEEAKPLPERKTASVLPPSSREKPSQDTASPLTPVRLKTSLDSSKARVGETVLLKVELTNLTEHTYPWPMVMLGVPGGLEPTAQALENLQKTGAVEWVACSSRRILCGWCKLGPGQTRKFSIPLKAVWAGGFTGPASWASISLDKKSSVQSPPLSVEIGSP